MFGPQPRCQIGDTGTGGGSRWGMDSSLKETPYITYKYGGVIQKCRPPREFSRSLRQCAEGRELPRKPTLGTSLAALQVGILTTKS